MIYFQADRNSSPLLLHGGVMLNDLHLVLLTFFFFAAHPAATFSFVDFGFWSSSPAAWQESRFA